MHGERCARRPPHAVPNPCSNLELEPRTPLSRNRLENQLLTMRDYYGNGNSPGRFLLLTAAVLCSLFAWGVLSIFFVVYNLYLLLRNLLKSLIYK